MNRTPRSSRPDRAAYPARRVHCQDERGRHGVLTVTVIGGQVVLIGPGDVATVLRPLQAGRLRAALRDVVTGGAS
ncbi:hypothetical protein [Amycolatopsis aidingensis]|uniref:hypothetical protein n=1 Tax=Amycolatopsis aidingensis TaxID=2842453 RepID=UPI001C0C44AD|nr:hypothetical protein [Amycolatopsis aidingensis]